MSEEENQEILRNVQSGQIRILGMLGRMKKLMDDAYKPAGNSDITEYGDSCPTCHSSSVHLDPDTGNYVCNDCHTEF